MTLADLFLTSCERIPDETWVQASTGKRLTYAQALQWAIVLIARLEEAGTKKGDRVLFYMDRTLPSSIACLACSMEGIVFLPISPQFSQEHALELAAKLGIKAILTTEELSSENCGVPIIRVDQLFKGSLEQRSARVEPKRWIGKVDDREVMLIQPTSGTTGNPKLVIRDHRSILRYFTHLKDDLLKDCSGTEEHARARFLLSAPLVHAFGFHMFGVAVGLEARICLGHRHDVSLSLQDVWSLDPTLLSMTPRVLRSLYRQFAHDANARARFLNPSAKCVIVAGGQVDPEIARLVESSGIDLVEIYGSSETSILSLTPRGGWKEGRAGRPLPDVEFKVSDEKELLVKTPGMMLGYYGDPSATQEAYDEEGFYKTGDLGAIDGDGYVQVMGRKKDAFPTIEGSLVFPSKIEAKLESIPWVRQAIVCGSFVRYLTALIVVDRLYGFRSGSQEGILDESQHGDLYARARNDLAEVNSSLESIEKVRRFGLLVKPFPESVYRIVGSGKVSRDRAAFHREFGPSLVELYSPSITSQHLRAVPDGESLGPELVREDQFDKPSALVIDGRSGILETMKRSLQKLGYGDVFCFTSAGDALLALEDLRKKENKKTIELVICEWQMPHIDGFELQRRLRDDPCTFDALIILMTFDPEIDRLLNTLSTGIDAHMVKPIDFKKLKSAIDRASKARRQRAA